MAMQRSEIIEQLQDVFAAAMERKATFDEGSRLVEDIGLNSVGVLFLVVGIEEVFGIRFENVGLSDFVTVGDIVDYIESRQTV